MKLRSDPFRTDQEAKLQQKLWQIVASERFANVVCDVVHIGGTIALIIFFYWLFGWH